MVGMLHVKSEVAGLNPRSQSPERVKNCVTCDAHMIGLCDLCIGGSNISIKLSAIGVTSSGKGTRSGNIPAACQVQRRLIHHQSQVVKNRFVVVNIC